MDNEVHLDLPTSLHYTGHMNLKCNQKAIQ
jgi:hypothetical protein